MLRKPSNLTDKLFAFLWNRHVENRTAAEAEGVAGISLDEVIAHRSHRTEQYVAAETRMDEMLPREMMVKLARATQYRLLQTGGDATAASMVKIALDGGDEVGDRPTTITFVIEDAAAAEKSAQAEAEEVDELALDPEPKKPQAYRCYVRPLEDRDAPVTHERVVLDLPRQGAQAPMVAAKSLRKRGEK